MIKSDQAKYSPSVYRSQAIFTRSFFKAKETETDWDGEPDESDSDSNSDWAAGFGGYGSVIRLQ
jgi:hypothetical protein